MNTLRTLWDNVVSFFRGARPEPDPRPDPEDSQAYAHAEKVRAEQDKRSFPLQTLRGRRRPSDVADTAEWEAAPVGYSSWVDVYEGPSGVGYVINYEVQRGSTTWRKAINFGPEKHREQDWEEVKEVALEPTRR